MMYFNPVDRAYRMLDNSESAYRSVTQEMEATRRANAMAVGLNRKIPAGDMDGIIVGTNENHVGVEVDV